MQTKRSRRSFLKYSTFAGMATAVNINAVIKNEFAEEKKSLVFLFQGDSITDGNRGRNNDPNHIMGHGYAFSVASRVGDDFASSQHVFYNRGTSGNKISDLKNRWQEDTIELKPDVLSVLAGINDAAEIINKNLDEDTAIDQFEKDYRDLLTQCRKSNPEILFVICFPFVYLGTRTKDNLNKYNTVVTKLAIRIKKLSTEFNGVTVDFPAAIDRALKKAPLEYWIWDGVHPTVPAHEVLARQWIKEVSGRLTFLRVYKY